MIHQYYQDGSPHIFYIIFHLAYSTGVIHSWKLTDIDI